jgi:hypothetical protein
MYKYKTKTVIDRMGKDGTFMQLTIDIKGTILVFEVQTSDSLYDLESLLQSVKSVKIFQSQMDDGAETEAAGEQKTK